VIVATAQDAARLFETCFAETGDSGERFAVAFLDGGRRLIELRALPPSEEARVELPMRRILEDALRLGARGIVVAHNHPSGDPAPSADDVEATRELAGTAARLGIQLHDHLIFAGGEVASLRSMGLL
jgi:DNA repair protein RadC